MFANSRRDARPAHFVALAVMILAGSVWAQKAMAQEDAPAATERPADPRSQRGAAQPEWARDLERLLDQIDLNDLARGVLRHARGFASELRVSEQLKNELRGTDVQREVLNALRQVQRELLTERAGSPFERAFIDGSLTFFRGLEQVTEAVDIDRALHGAINAVDIAPVAAGLLRALESELNKTDLNRLARELAHELAEREPQVRQLLQEVGPTLDQLRREVVRELENLGVVPRSSRAQGGRSKAPSAPAAPSRQQDKSNDQQVAAAPPPLALVIRSVAKSDVAAAKRIADLARGTVKTKPNATDLVGEVTDWVIDHLAQRNTYLTLVRCIVVPGQLEIARITHTGERTRNTHALVERVAGDRAVIWHVEDEAARRFELRRTETGWESGPADNDSAESAGRQF